MESDWYQARLQAAGKLRRSLWQRHVQYLEEFLEKPMYQSELERLGVQASLDKAKERLASLDGAPVLVGTLGADPALMED